MIINSVELGQSTTFKYDGIFHKFMGVWPNDDNNFFAKSSRIRSLIFTVCSVGSCSFQFSGTRGASTLIHVLEALTEGMASVFPVLKFATLTYYRDSYIYLIRRTKELNEYSTLTSEEAKIHFEWQNIQDKLIKLVGVFYTLLTLGSYMISPLFIGNGALPLAGAVPEMLKVTPWFQITYVVECLVISLIYCGYISNDCLSITLICQLCKQLELAQYSMKTLSYCRDKINLTDAIDRHAVALDYGQTVCETLTPMFLLQHLLISMFLCFAGIILLNTQDTLILLKMIPLSAILVVTLYISCFVGEMIISSSLIIATTTESSINCESFFHDLSAFKAVNLILCRAQRPLRLVVGQSSSIDMRLFAVTMNKLVSGFVFLRTAIMK